MCATVPAGVSFINIKDSIFLSIFLVVSDGNVIRCLFFQIKQNRLTWLFMVWKQSVQSLLQWFKKSTCPLYFRSNTGFGCRLRCILTAFQPVQIWSHYQNLLLWARNKSLFRFFKNMLLVRKKRSKKSFTSFEKSNIHVIIILYF